MREDRLYDCFADLFEASIDKIVDPGLPTLLLLGSRRRRGAAAFNQSVVPLDDPNTPDITSIFDFLSDCPPRCPTHVWTGCLP